MIPGEFDFRVRQPGPPLEALIERVWYARGTSPHGRERILPSPSAVLLLVLGDALLMEAPGDERGPMERTGAWLQGPHDRPILNEPTGDTYALGIVFRAGGLLPFLSGSVEETTNHVLRLDTISTRFSDPSSLLQRIRQRDDPESALDALETWLGAAAPVTHESDAWVRVIQDLVTGHFTKVEDAQAVLGVSRRYFVEQIRHRSGMTPKSLQLIGRMRRLLQEIDARQPIRWSSEAVGAGYFDQAHAIRDFKRFTGLTPTEYIDRRRLAWGHDVEPGEATNFVPEIIR